MYVRACICETQSLNHHTKGGKKEKGRKRERERVVVAMSSPPVSSVKPGVSLHSPLTSGGKAAKRDSLISVAGAQDWTSHSYSQEEITAVAEHVNETYYKETKDDDDMDGYGGRLPLATMPGEFFEGLKDGVVLCWFINVVVPETLDMRCVVKKQNLNKWELQENVNLCVNSARAVGVKMVNIGAEDIIEKKAHLVLSVLWQLIKMQLLASITLQQVPELVLLLEEGEELKSLLKLPPEAILIRWVNYHLAKSGTERRIKNLSSDIKDAEPYARLLHQLDSEKCDSAAALREQDTLKRAEMVLESAGKVNLDKYVTAKDIVAGKHQMNLAFVANIFNTNHGLVVAEEEIASLDFAELEEEEQDGVSGREERCFRNWINAQQNTHVHSLVDDLQDGVIFLETLDKLKPGLVNPKSINRPPFKLPFKKMENCGSVIKYAKELNLQLVGIGGEDIVEGNRKLMLGLLWQLVRFDTLRLLNSVSTQGSAVKGDSDVLKWANETVAKGGSDRQIRNFRDKSMTDGLFFIDLLKAIEPRIINPELVIDPAESDKDKEMNAKYVISAARKLGCTVYLLWEHIVEVDQKMLLVMTAALMAVEKKKSQK